MAVNVYATTNPEAPIGENIFPLLRWPRPAVKRRFDWEEGGFDRLPENKATHELQLCSDGRLEFDYGYIAFTSF